VAERLHAVAERVAALRERALPPTDLGRALWRARADWVPRFHRFEPAAFAEAEPRALETLDAIDARAASLEREAGRRGRLGVAGLAALGAVFAALAAARRRLVE
jgi:hypothetical protein